MSTQEVEALLFDRAAPGATATRLGRIPRPAPGADEVLVEVAHAGVNFKDVMCRRGDPGYVANWPYVPGMEVEGRVAALGADVEGLEIGQRVVALTNDGGLAGLVTARAALALPRPEGLDPLVAASVPVAVATAVLLLDVARFGAGEAIFVHSAAGAVGAAVAQVARHRGAGTIVGSVGDPRRRSAARAHGYDDVLVRGETLEEAGRFDVILDPHGTRNLSGDLAIAAVGGRVLVFGNASGDALDPLPPAGVLFPRSVSLGGFSLKGLSAGDPQRVRGALQVALGLAADGVVTLPIVLIDGLSGVPAAHDALARGAGDGKYVVRVQ